MLKYTVLFLFAFLATASITNPTLEKNLFFVRPDNTISYQLFQTRAGIIAYSLENYYQSEPYNYSPQYTLIDLQSSNISLILTDIMEFCNQGSSAFDRLHYHVETSSLVYYCVSNNSLLILDDEDFSVQRTVSTGITDSFDEVKLVTDRYSIAILGMKGLLSITPASSQLVTISMQTYEVTKHVVFDQGLSPGEAVTGYASNSKGSYILTNQIKGGNNKLTVYSMILIANTYNLTSIFSTISSPIEFMLSEFLAVGDLIFTNNLKQLLIINEQGTVIDTISGLEYKGFQRNSNIYNRVAVVSEYGSTDLYAQLANNSIIQISVNGAGYTSSIIANASDMQYVAANMTSNSLLFTIDSLGANFTITDMVTSQIMYTMVTNYDKMFITNSTYCFTQSINSKAILYIFSSETNELTAKIPIEYGYFYDQEQNILSFLNSGSNQTCQITQVDLLTGDLFVSFALNSICESALIQVMNNNHDLTQLVLANYGSQESYTILSQTFGLIDFVPPTNEHGDSSTVVVDYDSMTVYHFIGKLETNETSVFVYVYDSSSKNFTLQMAKVYSDLHFSSFFTIQDLVVLFPLDGTQLLGTITIPSLSEAEYPLSMSWNTPSAFLDNSGNIYIVLSDAQSFGLGNDAPGILYSGQIQTLPETDTYTVSAQAGGLCSYWILDGMVTSFGLVRVYNICSDDTVSSVSA